MESENNGDGDAILEETAEDDEALNMRIVDVMKQSEQYFENNMNGFCNNMALNSVNSVEISTIIEGFHGDTKERVI